MKSPIVLQCAMTVIFCRLLISCKTFQLLCFQTILFVCIARVLAVLLVEPVLPLNHLCCKHTDSWKWSTDDTDLCLHANDLVKNYKNKVPASVNLPWADQGKWNMFALKIYTYLSYEYVFGLFTYTFPSYSKIKREFRIIFGLQWISFCNTVMDFCRSSLSANFFPSTSSKFVDLCAKYLQWIPSHSC